MNLNFIRILICLLATPACASGQSFDNFLAPSDTLHPGRFWTATGSGAVLYGVSSVGLWNTWYKDHEIGSFHFFDDSGEWKQMDKMGHLLTAYNEAKYVYQGARWMGMKKNAAVWTGVGVGSLLQLTLETMDGFSEKWGFSWSDIGFNTLGVAAFAGQEFWWGEQRIQFKLSAMPLSTPHYYVPSLNGHADYLLQKRADELYGVSFLENALKHYNQLVVWSSVNVWSFLPERENSKFPKWLNVAVGYGAGNLYGGFRNEWEDGGALYVLDEQLFPRHRRYLLALDLDLSRIKTRSRLLNTILDILNFVKVPSPALEINSKGGVKWHPLWW